MLDVRHSRYSGDMSSPANTHTRNVLHRPTSSDSSNSPSPFMRKLKWKGRDDQMDFGCAGENPPDDRSWTDGPADFSDRHYGHRSLNRSSVTSSIPSLTHSRGHSSSSEFSTSTVESSLPPSPTPSCDTGSSLPYSSRVPLTPRTSEHRRRSDEIAAIDALNDYFTRVHLSRVEEDEGPAHRSPARQASPDKLEIEFLTSSQSTYTPLKFERSPEATFSPFLSLPASPNPSTPSRTGSPSHPYTSDSGHSSGSSTAPARSPDLEAGDLEGTLDALSAYFTRPVTPLPLPLPLPTETSRPRHVRHSGYSQESQSAHARPASSAAAFNTYGANTRRESRPRFSSQGHNSLPSPSTSRNPLVERRVPYGWI